MPYFIALLSISAVGFLYVRWRNSARADFIRTYMFPRGLLEKFAKKCANIGGKEQQLAARALRQFFLAYLKGGRKRVAMPSQAADDLWHEFILYTKNYQEFCRRAFGKFLHHTPAAVLGSKRSDNEGLRRVWWHTCLDENINPRKATRLPLLFALDSKLGIADGFFYELNCSKKQVMGDSAVHCASHFSDSSIDGTTDGFDDSSSGSDSSDGGSSDGGSGGCSGGCGGGD